MHEKLKGPWKKKCQLEYFNYDYGKDIEPDKETIKVEMKKVRYFERTIRAQMVEFMVLDMFSKGTIFGLIEFLFRDMHED